MTYDIIQGLIRHILTIAGGALVHDGFATQDQSTQLVGGAMALIGICWSLYNKYQHRKALAAAHSTNA